MDKKDHIIKVVNIPINIEATLRLSAEVPKDIPVQYELDIPGMPCEPIVNSLALAVNERDVNNLNTKCAPKHKFRWQLR